LREPFGEQGLIYIEASSSSLNHFYFGYFLLLSNLLIGGFFGRGFYFFLYNWLFVDGLISCGIKGVPWKIEFVDGDAAVFEEF
jgi:hypothetical protein